MHAPYHQKYHAIHRGLAKKGQRCADDEDTQESTTEDTLDRKQLLALVELLHAKDKADNLNREGFAGSALQPGSASHAAVPAPGSPPATCMTVVRPVPLLKNLRDVQPFWSVWQDGSGVTGPVKDLTAEEKAVGDVRKRFSEYSRAAAAIEQMALATHKTPVGICQDLDEQHERGKGKKPKALAAFLKELGNSKKQSAMAEGLQP